MSHAHHLLVFELRFDSEKSLMSNARLPRRRIFMYQKNAKATLTYAAHSNMSHEYNFIRLATQEQKRLSPCHYHPIDKIIASFATNKQLLPTSPFYNLLRSRIIIKTIYIYEAIYAHRYPTHARASYSVFFYSIALSVYALKDRLLFQ